MRQPQLLLRLIEGLLKLRDRRQDAALLQRFDAVPELVRGIGVGLVGSSEELDRFRLEGLPLLVSCGSWSAAGHGPGFSKLRTIEISQPCLFELAVLLRRRPLEVRGVLSDLDAGESDVRRFLDQRCRPGDAVLLCAW